jgi:hypothetical protein
VLAARATSFFALNQPTRTGPETVVLVTVQGFPLDTFKNDNEMAVQLQLEGRKRATGGPVSQKRPAH